MKSVYIVSRAKITGPINQALNILTGMKQNGRVDANLVTLAPEDDNASWLYRFKNQDINIVQFNQPLWKTLVCIYKLRKLINKERIDIVHACGFRADFVALFAGRSVKKIITQRCHPNEIVEKFPKFVQPIFSGIYMSIIKKMDAIVACSKSIQNIFYDEYSMDVECVQNGVNTDYFQPANAEKKQTLREELNLPQDKRIFLVLGSLRDRKNNSLIIDAVLKICNDSFVVVFVGSGPDNEKLRIKAGDDKHIMFAGSTKTPIKYLQACDILLSASLAEGLPNTVLEALSCGLPCILSDIGPHKELINEQEGGALFKNNDVNSLTGEILKSLEWDLNASSTCARNIVLGKFDIRSLAAKYEEIYKKALDNNL